VTTVAPTTTEPMPSITCACGFSATGHDEEINAEAFYNHDCPNEAREPRRWCHDLFNFWTWAIIVTVAWVTLGIVVAVQR
jgi:hypothetical protein